MKNSKYFYIVLITILFVGSCKQEPIVPTDPPVPAPAPTPGAGGASFTKFVAIGNSYVAGMQAGALFTDGQKNSLPAIMATQFALAGGGAFNQPSINATLGYNLFLSPNPGSDQRVLGRLLLQYGTSVDCVTGAPSAKPTPQKYALGNLEAVPNPNVNPAFIYAPGKTGLNNFGIPAIQLGQALIPQTGSWAAAAGGDPRFNPFYGRLAFPGTGTSTIIGDAAAAGGSFFLFWLGLDDFFLYAANGGDPAKAPLNTSGAFAAQYGAAIGVLLNSNANLKGVIANFPDIFVMPHFTAVAYNPIPLDATTAALVSGGFAGYNAALDGLIASSAVPAALKAELATRKITFAAGCTNKIVISDETLTPLGPYFDILKSAGAINDAQRGALKPYELVRQTTASDVLPLATGSILGTTVGGNATLIYGVTVPLADQYCLIPTEIAEIKAARDAFNSAITGIANSNASRIALADVSSAMASLVTNKAAVMNGVTLTPNINPPTGIYSEDGVHPNTRGYAFISTVFIGAINAKFGSTIPLTDVSKYGATGLPIK